jgi:hypothetical protein
VPLMDKIVSTLGFLLLPFHPGIKAELFTLAIANSIF